MRVHSCLRHVAFVHKHFLYYSGIQKQTLKTTSGYVVKMPGKHSTGTVPLTNQDYF